MVKRHPHIVEILTATGLIAAPFVLPYLGFAPPTINRILVWGMFGLGFDNEEVFGGSGFNFHDDNTFLGTGHDRTINITAIGSGDILFFDHRSSLEVTSDTTSAGSAMAASRAMMASASPRPAPLLGVKKHWRLVWLLAHSSAHRV